MAPFTGALFTPVGSSKLNSQERGIWNPADFCPLAYTLRQTHCPRPGIFLRHSLHISHILLSTVATDVDPVQRTDHHWMWAVSQWQYDFQTKPKDWSCQKHIQGTWPQKTNWGKEICYLKSRPGTQWRCPLVAANRWPLTTKADCLARLITLSSRFCDRDLRAHSAEVNSHMRPPHDRAQITQQSRRTSGREADCSSCRLEKRMK